MNFSRGERVDFAMIVPPFLFGQFAIQSNDNFKGFAINLIVHEHGNSLRHGGVGVEHDNPLPARASDVPATPGGYQVARSPPDVSIIQGFSQIFDPHENKFLLCYN